METKFDLEQMYIRPREMEFIDVKSLVFIRRVVKGIIC